MLVTIKLLMALASVSGSWGGQPGAALQDPASERPARGFQRLEPLTAGLGRVALVRGGGDADPRITRVQWTVGNGTLEIPLASPVTHCDAAVVGDNGLVILAGGNSEDLQVYTVGAEGGIQRFPTERGRRLPKTFADGLGSWPVADGRQLLMFAYQQGNTVQFRAIDFAGRIHATRALPEQTLGFAPEFVAATHQVRVAFQPGAPELLFPHPAAPRVIVQPGIVEFGTVKTGRPARRLVTLRNEGRSEAVVRGATNKPVFRLEPPTEWSLSPGEEAQLELFFDPDAPGTVGGRLELATNTPDGTVTVGLRGTRFEEPVVVEPEPEPPVPLLAAPTAPVLAFVEWRSAARGARELRGVLEPVSQVATEPATEALVLDSEGRELARGAVADGGGIRVEVRAAVGARLMLQVVGRSGRASPAVPLPALGPALREEAGMLVFVGGPGDDYRLAVVMVEGDRVLHEFAGWAGRLDVAGVGMLPVAALGNAAAGLAVVGWTRERGGRGWVRSNIVTVGGR